MSDEQCTQNTKTNGTKHKEILMYMIYGGKRHQSDVRRSHIQTQLYYYMSKLQLIEQFHPERSIMCVCVCVLFGVGGGNYAQNTKTKRTKHKEHTSLFG